MWNCELIDRRAQSIVIRIVCDEEKDSLLVFIISIIPVIKFRSSFINFEISPFLLEKIDEILERSIMLFSLLPFLILENNFSRINSYTFYFSSWWLTTRIWLIENDVQFYAWIAANNSRTRSTLSIKWTSSLGGLNPLLI